MKVNLDVIIFNHDPTSSSNSALNVRKNETVSMVGPEWQANVNSAAEDSIAVYSITETTGQQITIKAKFVTEDRKDSKIWIRAIDISDVNNEHPFLGNVRARSLQFKLGESALEEFELDDVGLEHEGVAVRDIRWQWQFRISSNDSWQSFQETNHRIYSLLAQPSAPWQQRPFHSSNTQLPWIDVIDHACRWAQGAKNSDAAAERITHEVSKLGEDLFKYDSSSFYVTWIFGYFNCTRFLERLSGQPGNGDLVNCTDCAAIVATFANAVGCSLSESTMGTFKSNPILRIGESEWWDGEVDFHEVAWKGQCGESDGVFDACYRVDGDVDPTSAPHEPMLPANIRFGKHSDKAYRYRLMSVATRLGGQPSPEDRQHRPVSSSDVLPNFHNLSLLKKNESIRYSFLSNVGKTFLSGEVVFGRKLDSPPGWRLKHADRIQRMDVQLTEHLFSSDPQYQMLVRIDQYECSSAEALRDVFAKILVGFQLPILRPTDEMGDVAVRDDSGFAIVFARNQFIYSLRNAGKRPENLVQTAIDLDQKIPNNLAVDLPLNK